MSYLKQWRSTLKFYLLILVLSTASAKMSQLLRQATMSTEKKKQVPSPVAKTMYGSPVAKLRDTPAYITGRKLRLQEDGTKPMPKSFTRFSTGFPGRKQVLTKNQPVSKADLSSELIETT